ncbi:MAG: CRTAC1 family protein, partial [Flavobacteriales bacterium]
MSKNGLCALLSATLLSFSAYSQSFQNIVNSLGVYHPTPEVYNGSGLSCADFNNDGWDDLTVCTYNAPVKFFLNVNGESFQDTLLINYQADTKAALWVDLDNDNDLDFVLSAFLGYTKVYRNDGNLNLVDVSETCGIPQSLNAMSYGLSASDINRDGWLDLYVCNYNWPSGQTNWLLINNGDFTFTNESPTSPANDGNRRSFQAAFIDLEHDLWPDLYVINDKNTRNSMYSNQEGVFSDISVATETDLYMESMSNSWCDFDHDGDLDVYITNGPIGNAFLRNDNGVFVDIAPELDMMVESLCWGAIWFDFNGDSWEDLYVCDIFPYLTDHNICFINNGDGTFTEMTAQGMQGDNFSSYACAYMDVDNNMAPDLVVINTFDQNVCVWRNSNTNYNALGLELLNQQEISGGIGSWVHVYGNNTVQNRYITCGDNYLSQNSHKQFFGLGSELSADSVIVEWPSGWVDKFYDLPKDSLITLHEGQTAQVNLLTVNTVI